MKCFVKEFDMTSSTADDSMNSYINGLLRKGFQVVNVKRLHRGTGSWSSRAFFLFKCKEI